MTSVVSSEVEVSREAKKEVERIPTACAQGRRKENTCTWGPLRRVLVYSVDLPRYAIMLNSEKDMV